MKYLTKILIIIIIYLTACDIRVDKYINSEIIDNQNLNDDTDQNIDPETILPDWLIINPYQDVDWENFKPFKANFHTHTTNSDGSLPPHEVVDRYKNLGYSILAITDHNKVTYPWENFSQIPPPSGQATYENRNPAELEMIDIQGNEFSQHHHTGSFFNDYKGSSNLETSLEEIVKRNGLAILFHPGRYSNSTAWYINHFLSHDELVGIEVYNQGDRYKGDRVIWDNILYDIIPSIDSGLRKKLVWAYSNDDMHGSNQLGRNWNILLMKQLTVDGVKTALKEGMSFFIYAPNGHGGAPPPQISKITISLTSILIDATNYQRIDWKTKSAVLHTGKQIDILNLPQSTRFIRAKLYGEDGTITGTQPFVIDLN